MKKRPKIVNSCKTFSRVVRYTKKRRTLRHQKSLKLRLSSARSLKSVLKKLSTSKRSITSIGSSIPGSSYLSVRVTKFSDVRKSLKKRIRNVERKSSRSRVTGRRNACVNVMIRKKSRGSGCRLRHHHNHSHHHQKVQRKTTD